MLDSEDISHIRHSLAHLLAAAVLELYPGVKNTIGPAIENGFYYDFDFPSPISEKDIPKIEKKMREMVKHWKKFESKTLEVSEARATFEDNRYKLELIEEIKAKGEQTTLYTSGSFTDLCRGGHVRNPSEDITPSSWKLSHIAGAYWRGDEKNKMLTRIYGLAFGSAAELDAYEKQVAEAKKRDHKKLGRELGLFTISPLVGAGLPLMQPKGMIIRKAIEDFLWDLHKDKGYQRVWTPHIAREDLYITSGHAAKFGDELFRVQGKEEKFIMKPMNCPHHMQIFADNQFSYRDMPVRYFESATVYRDEKSGQLGGLTRVRSITQDDGHLFCAVADIEQEVTTIVSIVKKFYEVFGLIKDYWVSLSVRDDNRDKYLGDDTVWDAAENALEKAAKTNELTYKRVRGEATFYGPKLDFMFKDSIGRQWQLATIQCDFNLPERFALFFINKKGEKERPAVIHRAISGSLERFMGIIIEHFAGAFPLWLSPIQVKVIPIGEAHATFAVEVKHELRDALIRTEIDDSGENLGKKVRDAKLQKIPYLVIIGDKEIREKKVTLESRDKGKIGELSVSGLVKKLSQEIAEKSL